MKWVGNPANALRTLPRLIRITRVVRRHGIQRALHGERRWPEPRRVREALEELGTVFLKFGQVLALRRDLLPAAYVHELERLHDRISALHPAVVHAAIGDALGQPVEDLFASFEDEPLASATIA